MVVQDLGRRSYGEVLELQRSLCRQRITGETTHDLLLLVEHDPVVTIGRGTRPGSLPLSPSQLERRGIEVFEVERGGDVTFHGPGQLVGYPIIDLRQHQKDLHWYLRRLEAGLIGALKTLGIPAGPNPGLTGVWTRGRKIASIGIHVKQWVTFHGFALNVNTDLSYFDLIVPCGIKDVVMTSVAAELGRVDSAALWDEARRAVVEGTAEELGVEPYGDHSPGTVAFGRPTGFSPYHARLDPTPTSGRPGGPADSGDPPGGRQLVERSAPGPDAPHPGGVHPAG
jgi:lipoyl(octanoyl) transferase